MTDLAHDGMYLVTFVPGGVANKAAPTTAELNAGVTLETRITPDGLSRAWTTDSRDTSKLNSTFNTSATGRRSVDLSITVDREVGDTTGVEAALVYQALGDLVIRDSKLASVPWTATDPCEVYPVQVQQPAKTPPAPNENQKITFGFNMTAEPELDALVA